MIATVVATAVWPEGNDVATRSASESAGRARAMIAAIGAPTATTITIAVARVAASPRRLRQRKRMTRRIPTTIMPMVPPTIAGTHAMTSATSFIVATIRSFHHTSMAIGVWSASATTDRRMAKATAARSPTVSTDRVSRCKEGKARGWSDEGNLDTDTDTDAVAVSGGNDSDRQELDADLVPHPPTILSSTGEKGFLAICD